MMPRLLEKHQADTQLMRAAMANPILALESIGIALAPSLQIEVERKVRFDEKSIKKINTLEKEAHKIVGKKLNLAAPKTVNTFLKKAISSKVTQTSTKASKLLFDTISKGHHGRSAFAKANTKYPPKDPLTAFKDQHELIPILLKYRSIDAAFPALASPAMFKKVLANKNPKDTGIRFPKVRLRLQSKANRKGNA